MPSYELYHHGIKGQKWGIRRYQNEDGSLTDEGIRRYNRASNIQRDLNKLDRQIAYNTGDMIKVGRKAIKLEKKANRYERKHPNDDKNKMNDYASKIKDYNKEIDRLSGIESAYRKSQDNLIRSAVSNGLKVSTKDISRATTRTGERVAKRILAGFGAAAIAMVNPLGFGVVAYRTTGRTSGKKYKVSNV